MLDINNRLLPSIESNNGYIQTGGAAGATPTATLFSTSTIMRYKLYADELAQWIPDSERTGFICFFESAERNGNDVCVCCTYDDGSAVEMYATHVPVYDTIIYSCTLYK